MKTQLELDIVPTEPLPITGDSVPLAEALRSALDKVQPDLEQDKVVALFFIELSRLMGGEFLYVNSKVKRHFRDREIAQGRANGVASQNLARRYGLSTNRVNEIARFFS